MNKELPLIEMNKEQVVKILGFIDATQDEKTKKDIFCELGNECFALGHSKEWGMSFQNNYQKLLDEVNVEKVSPYWEKLEFNADKSILYLTGKRTSRCVCAFGNTRNPPKSLCLHCCKTFQENIFGTVFNKKVEVEITESAILGGERCSTAIHIKKN
jgi:hypothetical protein